MTDAEAAFRLETMRIRTELAFLARDWRRSGREDIASEVNLAWLRLCQATDLFTGSNHQPYSALDS